MPEHPLKHQRKQARTRPGQGSPKSGCMVFVSDGGAEEKIEWLDYKPDIIINPDNFNEKFWNIEKNNLQLDE